MKTLIRIASALALILFAVTAFAKGNISGKKPDYSYDDSYKYGDSLPNGGPIIHVYSENGKKYDFVGHMNEPVTFSASFSGSCGRVYKANSAQFRIGDTTEGFSVPGGRGDYISRSAVVHLPKSDLGGFDAVKACNNKLNTLAAETNKSKSALIELGFGVKYSNQFKGRGTFFCSGHNNVQGTNVNLDVWVNCRAKESEAKPVPKRAKKLKVSKIVPLISGMQFQVDKENYKGECPTGVIFSGSITTSRAGEVKYRTVAHDGHKSPAFTLKFNAAGTKQISKWGQTFSKPDAGGTLSAGGGSDDDPTYAGWRRLKIVEPKGYASSTEAEYAITCQAEPVQLQVVPLKKTTTPTRVKPPEEDKK